MAINKVVYVNTTLIDLTDATATADKILTGYTAYGADGTKLVGTASGGGQSGGTISQDENGYIVLSPDGSSSSGGAELVASGTFTGNGLYYISFSLGTKMPQTNFFIRITADNESDLPYDTKYKFVEQIFDINETFASFDLSTNGEKRAVGNLIYQVDNNGVITQVTPKSALGSSLTIRNTSVTLTQTNIGSLGITKSDDGFSLSYNQGNSAYAYASGISYQFDVFYYGNNPSTDIVSV